MARATQSRRERHREDSARQIRTIALRHMAQNGTAAVSLRAIAREMGMSAGAVYGYYETRDALITALIAEVYDSLADTLERAVAEAGPAPAAQVTAYGRAYRGWALAHPQKFRLVYGDPVPDYRIPAAGPAAEAEHRACTVLTSVVAAAWPWARERVGDGGYGWPDYDPDFARTVRESFPALPPDAVALALRFWAGLHGLVCLELHGHLCPLTQDPEKLYGDELLELTERLGLPAADPASA